MIHKKFMKRALQLAERGRGRTLPNPMVGAVIAAEDSIIAEGFHAGYGALHAEADAVSDARKKNRNISGAVLYVTLEPCCHSGNGKINPPCTDLIIKSGIKKVVIASRDPNPEVNGKGIKQLEKHGIETIAGVLAEEEQALNRAYQFWIKNRLPFVNLKMAATLDSFTADYSRNSKWITGVKARNLVHRWRAESDGVMTGIGTVLADNPSLTARFNSKNSKCQPERIIIDTALKIPGDSTLVSDSFPHKTHIFFNNKLADEKKADMLARKGINLYSTETDLSGRIDLLSVMKKLSEINIRSILAEGGSRLAGSLLKTRLACELSIFFAPAVAGSGVPLFTGAGSYPLNSLIRIDQMKVRKIGGDFLFTGIPVYQKE